MTPSVVKSNTPILAHSVGSINTTGTLSVLKVVDNNYQQVVQQLTTCKKIIGGSEIVLALHLVVQYKTAILWLC